MLGRFVILILCMLFVNGCSGETMKHTTDGSVSEKPLRLEDNHIQSMQEATQRKYDEVNRKAARYIKRAEDVYELEKNVEKEIVKINKIFDEKCLSIEDDYQVRIFNLELQIDTLRNKPSKKSELQAELNNVRSERDKKIEALNIERNELIAKQKALLSY